MRHREVSRLGVSLELSYLRHSHSDARSAPCLWPTPQLMSAGSLTRWTRPDVEPASSWMLARFISDEPQWELQKDVFKLKEYFFYIFPIFTISFFFLFFFLFVFLSFRAAPVAYGGSKARGLIRTVAAGLHPNHSNMGPEPRLRPTPQLTALPDP